MLQMLFASALAEEGSAVQEAVSEVGDFFETAGDKAGNVIKGRLENGIRRIWQ